MPAPAQPRISKRFKLIDTLSKHLGGVNPENDYYYDVKDKVFYGRAIFGSESIVPFLSILEPAKPADLAAAGEDKTRRNVRMDLMVQGFVPDDKVNPLRPAYEMMAEVELRLSELISTTEGRPDFKDSYRLANLANDVLIGQGVARPPTEKVSPTAFFYIPLTVVFTHDLKQPFAE